MFLSGIVYVLFTKLSPFINEFFPVLIRRSVLNLQYELTSYNVFCSKQVDDILNQLL
jgi:hypothetical protein